MQNHEYELLEELETLHEFVLTVPTSTVGEEVIGKAQDRLHTLYSILYGEVYPMFGPY